ncbi:GDSL-type esterase/lipase family protein [Streptomyces indicus]|uniref:Lysophospholipase L1 n=1 Tax=Streptomyces indicus TaxID=417292 RepID=A0A1G8XC57_9ACTN|nr:GDSL-type esterase/lipase family protein [Streptomyces indicus]SDJ87495.1 Lysophospholipase L1 [Streptomyces indicus]
MNARQGTVNGLLRGVSWLDADGVPVRADPADRDRLPGDTWERATVPAGVRLECTAEAATGVEVRFSCRDPLPADAYRHVEPVFTLLRGEETVAEAAVVPGPDQVIRLEAALDGVFTLHLPEVLRPVVHEVRAVGGTLRPAPARPRWLVYGDSISEGWTSSRPHLAWPARAGRALGLDAVNLGYAGAARGELASAQQLGSLPADLITLAFGTNCWSRTPSSSALLYETTRAFLALVRAAHPEVPVLVVSPVVRPDAENTPNALGATLAELRVAQERAVTDLVDKQVHLLSGARLIAAEHMVDGVHPGDEGHGLIAQGVVEALRAAGAADPARATATDQSSTATAQSSTATGQGSIASDHSSTATGQSSTAS